MFTAKFEIVSGQGDASQPLVIKDLGPWHKYRTVTNDAEGVVSHLIEQRLLEPGQPLYYYDSDGELGELLVEGGKFVGFRELFVKDSAGG